MGVVRIALIKGKLTDYIMSVSDAVQDAGMNSLPNDEDSMFQMIKQLEPDELIFSKNYEAPNAPDGFMLLNILAPEQTAAVKQAFFGRIMFLLNENIQVRPETFLLIYSVEEHRMGFFEGLAPDFWMSKN
ncbi:Tautomerase enzyme [Pedobacter westerhofensis]|uniref:Tautomerase enzyme n=1 Tax=Pedobacter westerhofensis TaxID=425512 RepID=A0A521CUP3_9SPHI|nr:tautomerase family protein [Pedobacter westerhofensis]SMO62380.1 Tautomerase enzyme [Pedobacter westerhofensis]